MNKWILSASILAGLTLLIHTFGGELLFHTPALQSDLSIENKVVLSVIWHSITSVLALSFVAFIFAARSMRNNNPLLIFIAAQYAAIACLFIGFGLLRLGSLAVMPQWSILLLIVALTLIGTRNNTTKIGDLS